MTLGKMLQPEPGSPTDQEVPYINSVAVQWDGVRLDKEKTMWASKSHRRQLSVAAGDLMVCEGGDVGRSAFYTGRDHPIFQNSVHRIRPKGAGNLRYLWYLMVLVHQSGYLEVLCNKATIRHLTSEKLGAIDIPLPPLGQQQRIAAFLDDQVARIDQAIALTRSQRELFSSRDLALLDGLLGKHGLRKPDQLDGDWMGGLPAGWRVIHLSQVLKQLTNGYVGPTRDILQDDGIRYIQSVHIKNGTIDFERRPFYVSNKWHRERPRINLRPEDVLIVQTGAIGQVAVVPSDFGPASCHALLIARVQPSIMSGRYLAAYLRSPLGYQSLLSRATGALHPHLEGGVKDVNVIVPPLDVQDVVLAKLDELRRADSVIVLGLDRRASLLHERKRSLITAAVTGEFDVSSASTRALSGAS